MARIIFEDYKCPLCGNIVQVVRDEGRRRDKKHLKKMYCPFDDVDTNHFRVGEKLGKNWNRNKSRGSRGRLDDE